MANKYKFDLESKLDAKKRKRFMDLLKEFDSVVEPIYLQDYEVDTTKTGKFIDCVIGLETMFAKTNVKVQHEFYGIVGLINITGDSISVLGKDMGAFKEAVELAKTFEIVPSEKGVMQVSLTVSDLKREIKKGGFA